MLSKARRRSRTALAQGWPNALHHRLGRLFPIPPTRSTEPERRCWIFCLSRFECADGGKLSVEAQFVRSSGELCEALQVHILISILCLHCEEVPGHGRWGRFSDAVSLLLIKYIYRIHRALVRSCRSGHKNPYSQRYSRPEETKQCTRGQRAILSSNALVHDESH